MNKRIILTFLCISIILISVIVLMIFNANNQPYTVDASNTTVTIAEITNITTTVDYIGITLDNTHNNDVIQCRINDYNMPYVMDNQFIDEVHVGDVITVYTIADNNLVSLNYNEIFALKKDDKYYLAFDQANVYFYEQYENKQKTVLIANIISGGIIALSCFGMYLMYRSSKASKKSELR